MSRRTTATLVAALLSALLAVSSGSLGGPSPSLTAQAGAQESPRPIVFVHGFAGSGGQFQSQAMRFASNGYPVDHIRVLDYDSAFSTETQAQMMARLDVLIDDLKAQTGSDQVDLLGHSLGTGLMQAYLNSDPARAANVAHYVNLDGMTALAPPGGVDTLAVWGAGNPAREITGAMNVYHSEQTHTQVVTSSETFADIYEFFNGHAPATVDIVRQQPDEITVAGRALLFLTNQGAQNATLEIYEVDETTGARVDSTPEAIFALSGDGSWGPFAADGDKRYEFAIVRAMSAQHWYFQEFPRTDHLMRLLTAETNMSLDALWDKADDHANISIVRYKEWWGDQGAANDSLQINGTEVVNAATAPQSKRALAIFAYDEGSDGLSDVSVPVPTFFGLPFLTGVDLDMPAVSPPAGTIPLVAVPRLGAGPETINVPNWASSTDRISVQFHDFHVTLPPPDDPTDPTGETAVPLLQPLAVAPTAAATAQPVVASPSFTG
jgi:pimeloyl-ACP methyl ester carboxylesterase